METNINVAIAEFMKNSVNLDPDETTLARASRDWLIGQIKKSPEDDSTFPTPYNDVDHTGKAGDLGG